MAKRKEIEATRSGIDLGQTAFQPLSQLRELQLRDTAVSDQHLSGLYGISSLEMVSLTNTQVTEEGA